MRGTVSPQPAGGRCQSCDDGVLDLVTYGYSDLGEQSFLLLSNSEGFEYIERRFPQPLGMTGGHDTQLTRGPFAYRA